MSLSHALILSASQLQTQQEMTSQIRSHIAYNAVFNTYLLYSCAHFVDEIYEKPSLDGGRFADDS